MRAGTDPWVLLGEGYRLNRDRFGALLPLRAVGPTSCGTRTPSA